MDLKKHIHDVHDFPKTGIVFKDISPLLANVSARNHMVELFGEIIDTTKPTILCGLDARGFVIANLLAQKYQLPFVMIRKKGKLPGDTNQKKYDLEYGTNTIEIQKNALQKGDRVLLVDDLLATGGTLAAAIELIASSPAEIVGVTCVIELCFLGGKVRLGGVDFYSLIQY